MSSPPYSYRYVLDDAGNPIVAEDLYLWAAWVEANAPASICHDTVDDVRVSTVFLAIDYQTDPSGSPLLFETMIFGGRWADWCQRWHTRTQALAGHDQIVAALREGRPPLKTADPAEGGDLCG